MRPPRSKSDIVKDSLELKLQHLETLILPGVGGLVRVGPALPALQGAGGGVGRGGGGRAPALEGGQVGGGVGEGAAVAAESQRRAVHRGVGLHRHLQQHNNVKIAQKTGKYSTP